MDAFVQERNRRLFGEREIPIDSILVSNYEPGDRNFYALTGSQGRFIYSFAVVHRDGTASLVVTEMEEPDAKKTGLNYVTYTSEKQDEVLFSALDGERIGINEDLLPVKNYLHLKKKGCQPVGIGEDLRKARLRKSPAELGSIRKACDIVCTVVGQIPQYPVREGISEFDLQADIDYGMKKLGSEDPAFPTLVAFGENAAVPHHNTSNRKLRPGDLILVDFGATVNNLVSDITRTYVFQSAQDWQKELYKIVLEAQEKALRHLAAGMEGSVLYEEARRHIKASLEEAGLGGDMLHGLGHSIGYFVHDGARINTSKFTIPEDLVTTIEPGGYIEGKGGVRIEDNIIVLGNGIDNLTRSAPKDRLIEIG